MFESLTTSLSLGSLSFSGEGYHRLRRRPGWEECCLLFFPLCFDWQAERFSPIASHREVWVQDALNMTADELEAETNNADIIKFVQGRESKSWEGGWKGGAGMVGIKFQSGIWRFANNLFRRIFGISLRRGALAKKRMRLGVPHVQVQMCAREQGIRGPG